VKRFLLFGLLAASLTSCPQPTTPNFELSANPGSLTLQQGSSGTVTLEVSNKAALTDPIRLTLEGAPSGVTTAFDPASVTGNSSKLTLNVGNVAPGAYSLKVNASSGAVKRQAELTLNVAAATAPSFSLVLARGNTVRLEQGESRILDLVVERFQNFDSPVSLSLENAPTGVTASFDGLEKSSDRKILVNVAQTAELKTSTLIVKGKSGSLERTVSLELTVTEPVLDFELSVFPVITSPREKETQVIINQLRDTGFDGSIDVSLSGLPAGVTATNAVLTVGQSGAGVVLNVSDSAPLGSAVVTITGVSGDLTRTTTFELKIVEAISGTFDSRFGAVIRDLSSAGGVASGLNDEIQALSILQDGSIAVAGISGDDPDQTRATLARFQADGAFVGNRLFTNVNEISGLALQNDGKLVGAGRSTVNPNPSNVALIQVLNNSIDPDNAFGGDGQLATIFGSSASAEAVAVLSDGNIVTAGIGANGSNGFDFLIARYKPDPNVADKISLDSSFNGKGFTHIDFGSGNQKFDRALGIAVQPDGKIVVVGFTSISVDASNQPNGITRFAIARLNVDGSLDTSFDTDGKLTLEPEPNTINIANSVALEDLGAGKVQITVFGSTRTTGTANSAFIAQLNTDGTLNTAFDLDGTKTLSGGDGRVVLIDPDSKKLILVCTSTSTAGLLLMRLNPDGARDLSFGTTSPGNTFFDPSGQTEARAAVIQGDKILVGGFTVVNAKRDSLLVRFRR
jgi:uncharacterized delta-60 repeat protein